MKKKNMSKEIKEKNLSTSGFFCSRRQQSERLQKYLNPAKELKKLWKMKVTAVEDDGDSDTK